MSKFKEPPPSYEPQPVPGVSAGVHQNDPPPQAPLIYATSPPNPSYGATATTVIVPQKPDVIIKEACPSCRVGVLEDDFTCFGVLCAILFWPVGVLCCLAMTEKRCSNCGEWFEERNGVF